MSGEEEIEAMATATTETAVASCVKAGFTRDQMIAINMVASASRSHSERGMTKLTTATITVVMQCLHDKGVISNDDLPRYIEMFEAEMLRVIK